MRLSLIIGVYGSYASVSGTYTPEGYAIPDETVVWNHETNGDPFAAARRAIVLAAASIGKEMP